MLLVVVIALNTLPLAALAHDVHDHGTGEPSMRVWTFSDTGAHIHASYAASVDGHVQVRRNNGVVVSIEIGKLIAADQKWIEQKATQIRQLNENTMPRIQLPRLVATRAESKPAIADSFEPFALLKSVKYRQDSKFFYVESNSMPDHRMMVGITAWQQQVPMPQPYFDNNAWRIPLEPVVAKNPLSAKSHFFRGAIALAANGVPIFNPIKNDGRTDTLLAGELDEFGGHCGRADDYHYHIAPTHLQEIVGKDKPVAYALDGYAIYGYSEPDGSKVEGLDQFNGHTTSGLGYHYHATQTYPYINGGFHGEVVERDGQVDPQPRADGVRPALPPMRSAKIVDFAELATDSFQLTYEIQGKKGTVSYVLAKDGSAQFTFVDPNGKSNTENYKPRRGGERPPFNDPPRANQPAEAKAANKEKPETSG
jgi:hypothetical protein